MNDNLWNEVVQSDVEFLHFLQERVPEIVEKLIKASWACGYLTANLEHIGAAGDSQSFLASKLKSESEKQTEAVNLLNAFAHNLDNVADKLELLERGIDETH